MLPAEGVLLRIVFSSPVTRSSADDWAIAHAQELPQTIVDVKAFPYEYRRAILLALPTETRAALWRAHFVEFMDAHAGNLSAGQVRVLREALRLAVPETFAVPAREATPEIQAALTYLTEQIRLEFEPSEAVELFVRFGPQRGNPTTLEAARLTAAERFHSWFVVSASAEQCKCSVDSDWCEPTPAAPTMHCIEAQDTCRYTGAGCGTMMIHRCDGLCRP